MRVSNVLFAIFLMTECEILTSGPVPIKVKKTKNNVNSKNKLKNLIIEHEDLQCERSLTDY